MSHKLETKASDMHVCIAYDREYVTDEKYMQKLSRACNKSSESLLSSKIL